MKNAQLEIDHHVQNVEEEEEQEVWHKSKNLEKDNKEVVVDFDFDETFPIAMVHNVVV
jgi:hypothetical protein